MNEDRTINFGKYKGTAIKQLILEHIGYIYWCLGNLEWFKLNADEKALYDAVAIANIKVEDDMDESDILRYVDFAMYEAKRTPNKFYSYLDRAELKLIEKRLH